MVNLTTCPWCNKVNDQTSAVVDTDQTHVPKPRDGDLIMCMSCGRFAAFDGETLRRPTRSEVIYVATDPKCRAMRQAWQDIHADEPR